MSRAALIVTLSAALAPAAAVACGWWGETQGESTDEAILVAPATAIDLSTPEGMARMSRAYRLGLNVPQDPVLARMWAGNAARAGHVGAMNDYAQFLEGGIGGPEDAAGAREWFTRAAEAGDPRAAHSLAHIYLEGRGVSPDIARGETWLRRAAEAGHPSATADLAEAIWAGTISAREPDEACLWWLVAVAAGAGGAAERCIAEEPGLSPARLEALRGRARARLAVGVRQGRGEGS